MNLWTLARVPNIIKVRNLLILFDPLLLVRKESFWELPAHEFYELVPVFSKVLNHLIVVEQIIFKIGIWFNLHFILCHSIWRVDEDCCWLEKILLRFNFKTLQQLLLRWFHQTIITKFIFTVSTFKYWTEPIILATFTNDRELAIRFKQLDFGFWEVIRQK